MIRSFRCRETKAIHEGFGSRRYRGIEEQARKRLRWLDAATSLVDIGAIRGNRLEALKSDRVGQHSIRVNERWRICFSWRDGDARDVEIVDYH
ncbi:MAG: type II toxin-antitoxin system RelE/ParE family toxin [Bryobacteraceae bacterium]|jgi:proteic killer suppression protein